MALFKCKECGKEISDKANNCNYCGAPIKEKTESTIVKFVKQNKVLVVIGVVIIASVVYLNMENKEEEKEDKIPKINFQEIMDNSGCSVLNCDVAGDGSYLEVDTNPYDIDDYNTPGVYDIISQINLELGFTEALYTKMGKTRALDGTLTDENDLISVSWTYHPDNGFSVIYTIKNKENIDNSSNNI